MAAQPNSASANPSYFLDSLPTSVVGTPGSTITLAEMLRQSFGTASPRGFGEYQLSILNHDQPIGMWGDNETSYWGFGRDALDSYWLLDGQKLTETTTVSADDIGRVTMFIGNSMMNTTAFSVPVSAADDPDQAYRTYNVWTTQPVVKGAEFSTGQIDAADIVASAVRFDGTYTHIPNVNNCNWIADNVAAAAGAVMPYLNHSNTPSDNVSGGFWRIVYRGDEVENPVSNWSTLTRPGDVVRMVWDGAADHHTTTVTGTINADGYLPVYDNDDLSRNPQHYIREHPADYWERTIPEDVTIYRLDPNHQYLITGVAQGETLQGTVYDDLFQLAGGSDTVYGEGGNDSVLGNAAADLVDGGAGADTVYGAGGRDTLFGSEGNDLVFGQDGDDFVGTGAGDDFGSGGWGNDEVHGEAGNDLLFGDDDNDGVYGGDGDDIVRGGTGHDYLTGDAGTDQLYGEDGDDRQFGGEGGDNVSGGAGNDTLDGGADSDLLFGNSGDDVLTGGAGSDIFGFGPGDGLDRITDFTAGGSEADVIAFNGGAFADFAAVQAASRQEGADVVISYGAGDALTLQSVQLGALSAANFTFS
ncbi:MAG: calcium-binding protein [Methylobacterium frigidaeris]